MKKILFMILVFAVCLVSNEIKNKLIISIPKQDSQILKIPAFDLGLGESGIITRKVNNNEFIIGIAIVKDISNNVASLEVNPLETLKQRYMPTPIGKPQEKDKIIFRILYDRAIIIAPNQSAYQEILENNKNIDFIHPDIFITYLAKNDKNMPDVNDFKGFCDSFDIGLVFVAQNENTSILDCQSFKIISKYPFLPKDKNQKHPFFTRMSLETLDDLFNLEKMKDYFSYYNQLIESKNTTK